MIVNPTPEEACECFCRAMTREYRLALLNQFAKEGPQYLRRVAALIEKKNPRLAREAALESAISQRLGESK